MKKVTDIVAEIAAASNEQAAGIDQVNKAVMQLDELTQQNAALVEQASAASQAMAEQARDLNTSMSRYQVNATAADAAAPVSTVPAATDAGGRRSAQGEQALGREQGPRLPRQASLVRLRASPTAPTTRNGRSSEARASGFCELSIATSGVSAEAGCLTNEVSQCHSAAGSNASFCLQEPCRH